MTMAALASADRIALAERSIRPTDTRGFREGATMSISTIGNATIQSLYDEWNTLDAAQKRAKGRDRGRLQKLRNEVGAEIIKADRAAGGTGFTHHEFMALRGKKHVPWR